MGSSDAVTKHRSAFKSLLVLLNVWATMLTLVTLRENAVIDLITGRYDGIRQRLSTGSVNMDIAEDDFYRLDALIPPTELASYTFLTTPRRDTASVGDYRSVCTNINTNSAPVIVNTYSDFWGNGPRRVMTYVYSISAPKCQVVTVKPQWRDACIATHGGNATACYYSVLSSFDSLRFDQNARISSSGEFGARGVPFLRCVRRPLAPFSFMADLLNYQTYWNGGGYHASIQTSNCQSIPLVRSADAQYSLFEGTNVDDGATMLVALPPVGWFPLVVATLHSIVTLIMIAQGIMLAIFHTVVIRYLPNGLRPGKGQDWHRFLTPLMPAAIYVTGQDRSVITLKGSWLLASDVWISHWLYMSLSILDALLNIRLTYVTLQFSTSLLMLKVTFENMLFLFTAVTKIAWIMCLVQSLVTILVKMVARLLRGLRLIRSVTREKIVWNADGVAMFLTYRVYNVLLCLLVSMLLIIRGSPSFMVRAKTYRVPANGGPTPIAGFWGSEIVCDLFTLLGLLALIGQCLGTALLYTKYKHVADNRLMRMIQDRFMICGWDGLMAADMLGLDPSAPDFLINGTAHTKCSLGSLLQLVCLASPSGLVYLGGDYIFHDNGFSKEPVRFRFTVPHALSMGLFDTSSGSAMSKYVVPGTDDPSHGSHAPTSAHGHATKDEAPVQTNVTTKISIFSRRLRVVSDGYLGKLLLVDATSTGKLVTNKETGAREYEVIDALSTMSILDIKWLLGNEKKLRIE